MKKQPLLTLIMLIFFSSLLGAIVSLVFETQYERRIVAEAKAKGWAPPMDIGDAIPFFLLIGITGGFFLSLAAGSFWYVKVKAEEKEIQHII